MSGCTSGVDVLNGRDLYLKETITAGPDVAKRAETVRDKLIQQIDEGRQPRTNASLNLLIEKHLHAAEIEQRSKEILWGYHRMHIEPTLGTKTAGTEVRTEALETFYAELRRCRDHCDGTPTVKHYTTQDHRCTTRCKPHVCKGLAAQRQPDHPREEARATAAGPATAVGGGRRRTGRRVLAVGRPRPLRVVGHDHRCPAR